MILTVGKALLPSVWTNGNSGFGQVDLLGVDILAQQTI